MKKITTLVLCVLVLCGFVFANAASETSSSTDWPTKIINFIAGANPGGGTDNAARLYSQYLEKYLGQSIQITNVNGSNGGIATEQVAAAAADGYTWLCQHEGMILNKLQGMTEHGYEDFEIAGIICWNRAQTLITNGSKFSSWDEMISYAKANPGKVIFSVEIGGTAEMAAKAIEQQFGIKFQIVDGGNNASRVASVAGGHADISVCPMGNAKDYVTAGAFKVIAVFGERRDELFAEYPCTKECGLEFNYEKFFGIWLPKGTDKAIIQKISDALAKVAEDPEFKAASYNYSLSVDYYSAEDAYKLEQKTESQLKEMLEKYN